MIIQTGSNSNYYVVNTLISSASSVRANTHSPYIPQSAEGVQNPGESTKKGSGSEDKTASQTSSTPESQELSQEEQQQIAALKNIDREVRAHEAAHMAAGGGLVRGGASFNYQQGPDGRRYAVGGEVSIDTSAVRGNPEATLNKAQRIIAAALAPVKPSSGDRAVASSASQMAAQARIELMAEAIEKQGNVNNSASVKDITAYEINSNPELTTQRGSLLNEVI